MIRRPKPGETEEDLLEFQRQFLAEKCQPSVHVVSRPGDKRKTSEQSSVDPKSDRDVVHLEDFPEQPSQSQHVPPTKKSRFKSLQDEKKRQTRASKEEPSKDVIDDFDTSTATVLSKIIERDTRNIPVNMPSPVILHCPEQAHLISSQPSKPAEKKKKSLFSQRFAENPTQFGSFTVSQSPKDDEMEVQDIDPEGTEGVIDGSGLSATFGRTEAQKIHRENEERLAKMSTDEIVQEQQKLLQTLDPKLVDFLITRKSKTDDDKPGQQPIKLEVSSGKKDKKPKVVEQSTVPVEVKKEWMNMNKIEYDKLEWMKDLPSPSAGDTKLMLSIWKSPKLYIRESVKMILQFMTGDVLANSTDEDLTGQQARFDFKGNILPADADVPVNIGLHHHGDEPGRAGYTLGELFQLARSSNIQQRTLALQVLGRIISQAKEGNLSEVIQTPILPSILDAGVIFLLRWSLDDSTDAVVIAAVATLNSLLVSQADEMIQDHVFHWGQGYRVVCQASSEPEESGIKLPDVSDEKPEETDAEVAKRDLILGLVSRMCLLQRVKYILEVTCPQAPTVVALLQILIRIARHSATLAYQVASCPGLMDGIIKNFLPFSWTVKDPSQPLSEVYGVPLYAAMKLVRTLCQAGRHMASSLLSKYDLIGRLTRYLAVNVRDLNLPLVESYRLQIESLNTLKICLYYGLADTLYLDLYNVIVDELRAGLNVLEEEGNLAETKLTALIGALEAVLCVASSDKKPAGFKQSQDGSSMETERSEDIPIATVNWSHVADLIQPIRALLSNLLNKIALTYQMHKINLQVPAACLNFLNTYYNRCQTQLSGGEVIKTLQDMENVYRDIIQHWNSPGYLSLRVAVSSHSNLLRDVERPMELSDCLPEYGHCLVQGQPHISVTQDHSPINFLGSYIHLVYILCKQHKGVFTQEATEGYKAAVSLPTVILQCEYMWSYLRKIAQGKFSHLQTNYSTKFEYHLLYYILKLAMLPAHVDAVKTLDQTILHSVALHLLTGVQHGDEHLIHDLLSTVIYQPAFWENTVEEKASVILGDLSISETLPTQIKSATEQEIGFKQEDLVKEAQTNLLNIRSTYLASLQHYQRPLNQSRNHFLKKVGDTDSCFTSKINESLMPIDWMYLPLIELYSEYSSVRSEVQNILSTTQVGMVSSVLQWIYLLETYRPKIMNSISVTLKITRIMCTFLTGNDLFLDRRVYCFLAGLLRLYSTPLLLDKMDFTQTIPGLTSFYDLYISLLQQYEAVSFGDWLFGCYILIPLQQKHSLLYRKAIWIEFTGILRILSVPVNKLLIPVKQFLEPEETNIELIRLYLQSLIGSTLRHCWSPVLYLMAVHHVNRFLYTQDGSHKQLKKSMMTVVLQSTNEELKHHLLFYKKVDTSKDFGMDFYVELPQIRQNLVSSSTKS